MSDYGLVVIGGGEAGISAALRATRLGAKVCMINREPELGGGCVQTGTLPSKTLSNAAHFLENLKKGKRYGIPVVEGLPRLASTPIRPEPNSRIGALMEPRFASMAPRATAR